MAEVAPCRSCTATLAALTIGATCRGAVAKLPPDQLARFHRWFTAFEAGRTDHAEELDSTATKLGRLAGRASYLVSSFTARGRPVACRALSDFAEVVRIMWTYRLASSSQRSQLC